MDKQHALIFDIYRGTSHDGPGQRDTVFFKGCPLSCTWCHNPEGISPLPQVWWQERQCIGCGLCHEACPTGANRMLETGISIDRSLCKACGACVRACPAQAMEMCGREWTLDALVKEVLKNKPYYDRTGGGVTVSGGETMLQYGFVEEFFAALRGHGVTTALDTCGFVPANHFDGVLPLTDYVLYDLKLFDSGLHRKFCGVDNRLILDNAKMICSGISDGKYSCEFWIRTPLIPGATASEENLSELAHFVVDKLGVQNVSRWELCAFNNSCLGKYKRLEKKWDFEGVRLLNKAQVNALKTAVEQAGFPGEKLFATGIIAE